MAWYKNVLRDIVSTLDLLWISLSSCKAKPFGIVAKWQSFYLIIVVLWRHIVT